MADYPGITSPPLKYLLFYCFGEKTSQKILNSAQPSILAASKSAPGIINIPCLAKNGKVIGNKRETKLLLIFNWSLHGLAL